MKGIQEELQRVQDELRLAKTETSNAQYLMRQYKNQVEDYRKKEKMKENQQLKKCRKY